jgi:thymidylate synthase
MKVIKANTVDRGLQAILTELNKAGNYIDTNSRNGPVRRFRGPASIMWMRPQFRVSFDPVRDANPAFHLFEALWMLSGENDVKRPAYFASQMGQFSDDGETFHGAYGHRWVKHFGIDQIREYVIPALRKNKEDRRVVLQMWDGDADPKQGLNPTSKDVPCNLTATFDAAQGDGRLHLNVFNRSNDIVWGATGANVVHFSMLQEYVASALGIGVGIYEQISTNSHVYLELNEVSKKVLAAHNDSPNRELPYTGMLSMMRDPTDDVEQYTETWQIMFDDDIQQLMANYDDVAVCRFRTKFFRNVVRPVISAFNLYKNDDDLENGLRVLLENNVFDQNEPWYQWYDWNVATYQWLQRRIKQRNSKIAEYMGSATIDEFEANIKKVWRNVERVGTTFVLKDAGHVNPIKADFEPARRTITLRGLNTANTLVV